MRPLKLAVLAAALLAGLVTATPVPVAAADTLEGVVIVSRHGVRAPEATNAQMRPYSSAPWPRFGVPLAFLTPEGKALAKLMGGYYGARYRDLGLFPASGCLPKRQVSLWADNTQRTILTAKALQNGMLPGCSYRVGRVGKGKPDPLFDPVGAGICTFDDDAADAGMLSMIGGSWYPPAVGLQISLNDLQDTLGCCTPKLCKAKGLPAGCTIMDFPADEESSGPIGVSSELAENFIMQYANGFPMSQVAWGRLPEQHDISFLNMGHALEFWAGNANPYTAARQGSNLANRVMTALSDIASGKGPKLSVLVGHDNNLLNVAGLLGAQWFIDSYQQNYVPPGSAIVFELWRTSSNAGTDTGTQEARARNRRVEVIFVSQTLDQLRDQTTLDLDEPPGVAPLTRSACGMTNGSPDCTLARLQTVVRSASAQACIAK